VVTVIQEERMEEAYHQVVEDHPFLVEEVVVVLHLGKVVVAVVLHPYLEGVVVQVLKKRTCFLLMTTVITL
jgi:hypothetical protein